MKILWIDDTPNTFNQMRSKHKGTAMGIIWKDEHSNIYKQVIWRDAQGRLHMNWLQHTESKLAEDEVMRLLRNRKRIFESDESDRLSRLRDISLSSATLPPEIRNLIEQDLALSAL